MMLLHPVEVVLTSLSTIPHLRIEPDTRAKNTFNHGKIDIEKGQKKWSNEARLLKLKDRFIKKYKKAKIDFEKKLRQKIGRW